MVTDIIGDVMLTVFLYYGMRLIVLLIMDTVILIDYP